VKVCTYEYEILDKIRESSISDDEEPGDWAGYSLMRLVSVVGGAGGIAQMITSASGHQLERLYRSTGVSGRANREEPRRFEIFAFPDETPGRAAEASTKHIGINYNTLFVCLFVCWG